MKKKTTKKKKKSSPFVEGFKFVFTQYGFGLYAGFLIVAILAKLTTVAWLSFLSHIL
jgi:hypothetical protein